MAAVKSRGINAYEKAYAKSLRLIESGDFEAALSQIRRLMKVVTKSPDADIQFIPSRDIDGLFSKLGHAWKKSAQPTTQSGRDEDLDVLILTSFVWDVGGHTREIEDWVVELGKLGQRTAVMTSLPSSESNARVRNELAEHADFYDHALATQVEALGWLVETIERLQPEVVIVSPEALDVALFAALSVLDFEGDLILNLNLDHNLSSGLFIERVDRILVKRPYLYCLLKDDYKLDNLVYIPFARSTSIAPESVQTNRDRNPGDPLVTFSCTSTRYKIENDYAYRFVDVMPEVLTKTNTRHVHVGDISQGAKDEILGRLTKSGIETDRFLHIPFAERLGDVFIEQGVDILIQTFPIGGGLVAIEAMEAGLVVINHRCYHTKLFNPSDFCYPGAPVWTKTSELVEILESLDRDELARHHEMSRAYYQNFSMPGAIEKMLASRDYAGSPVDEEWTRELFDYPLEIGRILGNRETTRMRPSRIEKLFRSIRSRSS